MKITLIRYSATEESTLGLLFIDGKFHCYTLEDQKQTVKIKNETRIPEGMYLLQLRKAGRLHERYLNKFREMHHGMLHLQNVPGFQWIYIHIGNTDNDTSGCILVGNHAISSINNNDRVNESTKAYCHIYPIISSALINGDKVYLKVCGV